MRFNSDKFGNEKLKQVDNIPATTFISSFFTIQLIHSLKSFTSVDIKIFNKLFSFYLIQKKNVRK